MVEATTAAFAWDGDAFIPLPVDVIELADIRVESGKIAPELASPEHIERLAAAVRRVNPRIRVILAPAFDCIGSTASFDGFTFMAASKCRRDTIIVSLAPKAVEVMHHELFHTVFKNFREDEIAVLVAYGDKLRRENSRLADADEAHPDRKRLAWFELPEEAECEAFARFAVEGKPMFAIAPPWRVRRLFRSALKGQRAHHVSMIPHDNE